MPWVNSIKGSGAAGGGVGSIAANATVKKFFTFSMGLSYSYY